MSNALNLRLAALYSTEELRALDAVSGAMLSDPTIFDTHSREVRSTSPQPSENENGT